MEETDINSLRTIYPFWNLLKDIVLLINDFGKIEFANRAYLQTTNYSNDEIKDEQIQWCNLDWTELKEIIDQKQNHSVFFDFKECESDLNITLQLYVKIIKIEKMDVEVPVSDTFIITNNGTLDQRMTLNFKNSSIGNDGLEKIKYSLSFESSENRNIQGYGNGEETLLSLFNKNIQLLDAEGNEIVLNDGEVLTATLTLNMQRDMPENYSNAEFKFDLNIGYTQENSK